MPSSTTRKKRSGDPRKGPDTSTDKYAPSAWGSRSMYEDLTFPSGQVALVRRPGLEGLIKEGILHNLDVLTPLIEKHTNRVKGRKEVKVDVSEVLKDPQKMIELTHLLDRIVCTCVVKPDIQMEPNDPTTRENGVVYTDMVELEDKMFLMNFVVGGTRDLGRFRGELDDAMGSLRPVEEDEGKAE